MLKEMVEIIRNGEKNGDHMLIRLPLSSGIDIYGLPTENAYGGEWDLGPTWNYLVLADQPFLVDTGRRGTGKKLFEMMETAGIGREDLSFVLLSHGHEDHDGGLAEMVNEAGVPVKAHDVYNRLIRFYPEQAPSRAKESFPASCWRCFMPESFSRKHCLDYHQERSRLTIEAVSGNPHSLGNDITVHHVPGHSPDSLALSVGGEILIVGDTLLPDITPWPSQEGLFREVQGILRPEYPSAESVYGLRAYIRSLKKLAALGNGMKELLVLPSHRLFYDGEWKDMNLATRVHELIAHHQERCAAILKILGSGPKTARDIARVHFEERLLKGYGMLMAENEIISHCELMAACGDVLMREDGQMEATGAQGFELMIRDL
jgi:glyoxylase-like metal-dependent hydrolase (beta-lactamase superfamily II)